LTVALDSPVDHEWSTDSVCGQSALTSWKDHLVACLTELDIESRAIGGHHGQIRHFELGPVQLNFLSATSQRVLHSAAMVNRSSNDYLLLFFEKEAAHLRHYGLEMNIPAGCFVLLDTQQPFELLREKGGVSLAMRLEDAWLRRWLPHPKAAVATPTVAEAGWGLPLAATLRTIARFGLADAFLPRSVIADQLGASLAMMFGRHGEGFSRHHGEVFVRLKRCMQEQLGDPNLDPVTVANAVGISKRHLHGLFAQAGLTFGALLIDMRLERAATMLRDRRFNGYRAADVAWTCGFSNASHFARRFRAKYGAPPANYRRGFETVAARVLSIAN
jgi:AraC-like DNA-binding protein